MGMPSRRDVQTTCAACQTAISADATVCASCHSPVVRRYCPKCSRLVPEHTKLCPYCGASSKMKPRDTTAISQVAILVILGLAAGFFLLGGYFPAKKETRKLEPPPAVELGEKSATSASVSTSQMNTSATLPISGSQQPVVRSDEEGTRLNLQAYELIQQKNYQQAEPVLRRAVQSFPPGTTAVAYKYALYNLGHVLRRTGRAKEAIPFLEKCVQIDPQWSKAQSELATARAETQSSAVTQISQNTVRQQP